ncbi:MAG: hypothetical protein KJZ91_13550 [Myxococcales bacterium]|nr:hypothetical protein [Myxococcales bacterium]
MTGPGVAGARGRAAARAPAAAPGPGPCPWCGEPGAGARCDECEPTGEYVVGARGTAPIALVGGEELIDPERAYLDLGGGG